MRLVQWQQSFINALETKPDSRMAQFMQFVEPNQAERLEIYRNNNQQALIATLVSCFGLCHQILGEQCFHQFAKGYAHKHPLTQVNLNAYGEGFSEYLYHAILQLQQTNPAFNGFEYLGDFAQLEWCIHQAYYAQDKQQARPIAEMAILTETEQAQVQFILSADVHLLSSFYDIGDLWHQLKAINTTAIQSVTENPNHSLADMKRMLVYRQHYHGTVIPIKQNCYQLLSGIKQGLVLSELMLAELDMSQLALAIESGWIVGFDLVGAKHD